LQSDRVYHNGSSRVLLPLRRLPALPLSSCEARSDPIDGDSALSQCAFVVAQHTPAKCPSRPHFLHKPLPTPPVMRVSIVFLSQTRGHADFYYGLNSLGILELINTDKYK